MAESPTRLEKGREVLRAMDDRFALRTLSAVLIPLLDRWTSPDPDIDAQPGFGLPRRRGPAVYRGRPPFGVSDMSAQERSISKTSIRLRQRTTRVTSARAGGAWGWWGIGQAGTKPPRTMPRSRARATAGVRPGQAAEVAAAAPQAVEGDKDWRRGELAGLLVQEVETGNELRV